MARVAFPSYDLQTVNGTAGGVGTFITHFARLLKERGDDVTLVLTRGEAHAISVDPGWRERYRSWGIDLIEVNNDPWTPQRWPELWPMRLSEKVAPVLRDFDVVYFSDWGNTAFHTVRMKRFTTEPMPVCVTVLHGATKWVLAADRRFPEIPGDVNQEFLERYSARHSDFVVSPSRFLLDWVKRDGWEFAREPEVLGLPYLPRSPSDEGQAAGDIRRLIFFGRLQARKGYDLFVRGVQDLARTSPETVARLEEVVLLGYEEDAGAAQWVQDQLQRTGLRVSHRGDLDSAQATEFLRKHVPDALVVVPSPLENFPMAVIEASLIPGLNLICTRGGGAPEVFAGGGEAQLFEPSPEALSAKMRERIQSPLMSGQLARYDHAAANERWLEFHERACAPGQRMRTQGQQTNAPPRDTFVAAHAQPRVAVCVTYYNKARHFPQLLDSLTLQTSSDFTVIAIDDGSSDEAARALFDEMADHYTPRGWTFIRQSNRYVDGARNEAARRADAEYLLMIDADDAFAPNAIERFLEAAHVSGDDCLVGGSCVFTGDDFPYDRGSGELVAPLHGHYMPLGPDVVGGIVEPTVFGGPVIFIRRQVFEAIGGYREVRGAIHEDWELHARLALAGYHADVLPEYLHFYRKLPDGLARTGNEYLGKQRMSDTYDTWLAPIGMHGVARAMYALYRKKQDLQKQVRKLENELRLERGEESAERPR